jgi:hypothetical protein
MSKYSKIMTMRSGGKMEITQASVGLLAKGLKRGIDMVGVSKEAIQKAAATKAFPERYRKASEAYQKGNPEMLKGMKLKDSGESLIGQPSAKELAKAGQSKYVERSLKGLGIGATGAVAENEIGVVDKLKKLMFGK